VSRAVVVVWVGALSLRTTHEPDLSAWAESRQVALEDLAPDAPLPDLSHDDEAASRIEGMLAEASSSGEPGEAVPVLASAESSLRSHPDLPESAWLMAEILRMRASFGDFRNGEDALTLRRLADALEGARAATFDPAARANDAGSTDAATPAVENVAPTTPFVIDGLLPTDELYVDGTIATRVPIGVHHLRVVRSAGLAFAGWTDKTGAARIRIPGTAPCSAPDLGAIDTQGDRVLLGHPVLCPDWVVARSAGTDRVEVARCRGSYCGIFLPWRRAWGASFEEPVHPPWPKPKSNSWIFWTAASVAAAATASMVLWQAGAFEREPEKKTTLVFQGP
jgi:hypothetical protein